MSSKQRYMKRIILSCIICCMALCVFAQKPSNNSRYTVIVQEGYPICLSQYTYMVTPDCDLYYTRGVFLSPQIYHTKISEEQYSSIFSDEEMRRLQRVCANDSIVYNRCGGIDESAYAKITIRINGFQVQHIGQCTFPSGFDSLIAFLHDNEPKFSRFTGKLTRKSSKRWTQVAAMPDME